MQFAGTLKRRGSIGHSSNRTMMKTMKTSIIFSIHLDLCVREIPDESVNVDLLSGISETKDHFR